MLIINYIPNFTKNLESESDIKTDDFDYFGDIVYF